MRPDCLDPLFAKTASLKGRGRGPTRLTGLDALRGAAAVAVLLFHIGHLTHTPWLVPRGYLAVDFFFMISGYVLARTYEKRLAAGMASKSFLWLRIKRLWPTMAIATVIAIPLLLNYQPAARIPIFVTSLLFVPLLNSRDYYPLNGPQWSILFELFANVVHALVLYRLSNRALFAMAGASAVLTALAAFHWGNLDVGGQTDDMIAGVPRVLTSYCGGILLWRTLRDKPPAPVAPLFLAAVGSIGAMALITGWLGDVLFVLCACPVLLIAGMAWDAGKVGSLIGATSFPLYAYHAPAIYGAQALGLSWPVGLAVALGAAMMHVGLERAAGIHARTRLSPNSG